MPPLYLESNCSAEIGAVEQKRRRACGAPLGPVFRNFHQPGCVRPGKLLQVVFHVRRFPLPATIKPLDVDQVVDQPPLQGLGRLGKIVRNCGPIAGDPL